MKVLVVLALAVAVAQAGFTGSLNQQARPHLQQAIQQIRSDLAARTPARNSAEAAFQAKFIQGIQEHIENQLNNIQSAMTQAQATVQQIIQASQNTVAELQQVGNAAGQSAQNIVSSFIASVMALLNSNNGRALSPAMQMIVEQIVLNPTFIALVRDSATYKCLSDEGITVTFPMVQAINADKPDGWNTFLADEAVQHCINEANGLTQMIQSSPIVSSIQGLLAPMGLTSIIHQLINANVGEPWASQIIAGLSSRGLFSNIGNLASGAWDSVSGAVVDAASGAWNHVTTGAGAFANFVSQMASSAMASAADKFEVIKQVALQFVMNGAEGVAQMAADQAFSMIAAMAPHAATLGNVFTQAVDLYQSVHGIFNPAN